MSDSHADRPTDESWIIEIHKRICADASPDPLFVNPISNVEKIELISGAIQAEPRYFSITYPFPLEQWEEVMRGNAKAGLCGTYLCSLRTQYYEAVSAQLTGPIPSDLWQAIELNLYWSNVFDAGLRRHYGIPPSDPEVFH